MDIAALCPRHPLADRSLTTLETRGIHLHPHREFAALMATLRARRFDAVLIEEDAQQLAHWLPLMRMHIGTRVPVIVLGLGLLDGIARALQHGADDYASMEEGIDAAISRTQARVDRLGEDDATGPLKVGTYALDPDTRLLVQGVQEVSLTAREFALARTLFENHGRIASLNLLSTRVWGRSSDVGKRTIEQHIYKLRRKLDAISADAESVARIQTIYGVGYRLRLERGFGPLATVEANPAA